MRLYGLRMWVEQSSKQMKGALGWAEYQVRSDMAMRRHWVLVWCAFSFCWWHLSHGAEEVPPWMDEGRAPVGRGEELSEEAEKERGSSARGCAGQERCERWAHQLGSAGGVE